MDKNALREMLERQVQEKIDSGYKVNTYAADAAEPNKLKRLLNTAPSVKKSDEPDPYDKYLESVKNGTYEPIKEDDLQAGYIPRDYEREAKGLLTVHSRSKGRDTVLGAKPRTAPEKDPRNIRLDDLAQFR